MNVVYKYQLPLQDNFQLHLPEGARCLSVQVQYGTPCLWALVNPEAPVEKRQFRMAGTGHPIELVESLSFIDTFQLEGGSLIFHVFEIPLTT